jgi:5-methylcytosine-specific restriction enzyme subunit McrC
MNCSFDELTVDTLPNQILKSTCVRLVRASNLLTKENRALIRNSGDLLGGVSMVRISNGLFRRVQLHRNNRKYRLLLNICELLNNCYSPSEATGVGRFTDFLEDDVQMSRVFESFVLQFARKHCSGADVRSMQISWDGVWDSEVAEVLPTMKTDVTIDHPDGKTILDCKFYRQALVTRYDRKRLHSSHLYQLTAYLTNQARYPGWENVKGILLYPAVDHHLNHGFEIQGHRVDVRSIDLNLPWHDIHEKLLEIVVSRDAQALPQ